MASELISWRDVDVWHLDSEKRATAAEAIELLREYRATGAIANAVLADPSEHASTPEGVEDACAEGPAVNEIDWAGFPE